MSAPDPPPYDDRRNVRTASFIGGGLVALVAIAVLLVGGVALWGEHRKDDQGYASLPKVQIDTASYAVTTKMMHVDLGSGGRTAVDGLLGTIRLRADATHGKPLFVGIARSRDVARYLRHVQHATVTEVDDVDEAVYRDHGGSTRPGAPGRQSFWAASAQGGGHPGATWKLRNGRWSVVVMNADGSRGVHTDVRAAATLPVLPVIGWVTTGIGVLFAIVAAGLFTMGARIRPRAPRPGSGSGGDTAVTAVMA